MSENSNFKRFVEVIAALRDPVSGCPWDLEQTHKSIRPYLIEEAYETLEAIDSERDGAIREELGDLLLQVVLHAQIAKDRGAFTIDEVVAGVTEKMIRRHPHVFGEVKVSGSNQVLTNWEQIKAEEKKASGDSQLQSPQSILDGVPAAMPQLTRGQRIGEKASRVNFDWEKWGDVFAKVKEEIAELEAELLRVESPSHPLTTAPSSRPIEQQQALESEFGDVLFSLCQLGRWFGISSEDALRRSIGKFITRFQWMERNAGAPLKSLNIEQLEEAWEKSKLSCPQ